MKSGTTKDFVIITNVEHNKFYEELKVSTGFEQDKRIKFVGTVYDQELLKRLESRHMHIFMVMRLGALTQVYWRR